ncbi:MAG: FKBP-type peptidyl-prolyl cis-trans isomerase [Bacteroidota bacterium]
MIRSFFGSAILLSALLVSTISFAQTQADKDEQVLKAYFAKNKIKATRTPAGVYYVVSKKGSGENMKAGQHIAMKYLGTFLDGKRFDGNMDEKFNSKGNPYSFTLGAGQVIRGWDEGIQHFNTGSRGTIYLPSAMGYGAQGMGPIPPNSVLVFHIEVVGVQ